MDNYVLFTNVFTNKTRAERIKHAYKDAEIRNKTLYGEEAFIVSQHDLEMLYDNYFNCQYIHKLDMIDRVINKDDIEEQDRLDIIRESQNFEGLEDLFNHYLEKVLVILNQQLSE